MEDNLRQDLDRIASDRIRSAARHLLQESRRAQSELFTGNLVYFKLVAEEMEKEHDSDAVAQLRQGLLQVLDCAQRLEHQCLALQELSQNFVVGAELTDFSKVLDETTRRFLAADPFDATKDKLCQQFDRSIWNVHHPGEVAPGQEEEEICIINSDGIRNNTCPLTGRPVTELQNPVRSAECQHIYDQEAVMAYIASSGRRCKCAVAGCPTDLKKNNFKSDALLAMEIQEQRHREQSAQVAAYTELDFDD